MRSGFLRVPGAALYYEVGGEGPVLLVIPGGGGDAGAADGIAAVLRRRFTVVTFDARGYSRSALDSGVPEDQFVAVQSDDAVRLLAHFGAEPAYVVGVSNGAIVGLDLLARHPERVRGLVAHEPPCFAVLPDAEEQRAMVDEVVRLLHAEGPAAAGARFFAGIGGAMKMLPETGDLPVREVERRERGAGNAPIMLAHELREFISYVPDYAALAPVADRLTLAAGRETRGCLPYRPAVEIARRLGLTVAEFPGAHNGMTTDAVEFAEAIAEALSTAVEA
ncbi:alpha/beta fold hydrolase [Nocardia sp. BMG111209]|uniref:alpha/beta fold hydrolase n=1 Tax=Nocardia sp. BMG111209 TaxID=1160137 RepID=UPI0004776389|nr:alpha/beta hydrolase [Nocardia sp. BMG111209]